MLRAGENASGQLFYGRRLVAGGRVIGNEFKHVVKLERDGGSVKRADGLFWLSGRGKIVDNFRQIISWLI